MIQQTFAIEGTADIDVHIESGRLEVHEGAPGRVNVEVDTKLPGFIVEQRGNTIVISSDRNSGWLSRGSAYVVVEAPPGSDLRAGVVSAGVTIDVDMGKVDIKSASGDIDVEAPVETLVVKTASGDLHAVNVERGLRVTSASGDVRVERVGGSVVVSTASGDIHIEQSDAVVETNTASGDTYIRRFTGRSANFKAMSGSVDLGVPSRTSVDLDVNTLSGKVRLPEAGERTGPPERHMTIRAKLVSGDFQIDRI